MTVYLDNDQYRKAKTALTRKVNAARKADPGPLMGGMNVDEYYDAQDAYAFKLREIITHVEETFEYWDANGYAYPDSWHSWNIAAQDAEFALVRL